MESPLCPPSDPGFRLIETFRWEPGRGILRADRHLARLMRSAARLGIAPRSVAAALDVLAGDQPLRVRLTVDVDGRVEVTCAPFLPLPDGSVWRVTVADQRLCADDPWLGVKTTQRQLYDAARADLPADVDELLFLNDESEVCEGTITNVFVKTDQGLLTPALSCGVLPGILREELLETGQAREAVLTADDLFRASEIFAGNSLRGLIPAELA